MKNNLKISETEKTITVQMDGDSRYIDYIKNSKTFYIKGTNGISRVKGAPSIELIRNHYKSSFVQNMCDVLEQRINGKVKTIEEQRFGAISGNREDFVKDFDNDEGVLYLNGKRRVILYFKGNNVKRSIYMNYDNDSRYIDEVNKLRGLYNEVDEDNELLGIFGEVKKERKASSFYKIGGILYKWHTNAYYNTCSYSVWIVDRMTRTQLVLTDGVKEERVNIDITNGNIKRGRYQTVSFNKNKPSDELMMKGQEEEENAFAWR